ncbi:MAG: rhodanese-like domain-containing protein [Lachnospiraceae bacterium]|nr:rhodanese-like domain-containing protein [Lachnospiraceae bacterium]
MEQVYGFEMIQPEKVREITAREKVLVIDLRSSESYRKGHIRNARNYPYEYIKEWSREIPDSVNLILYCEHGNQSLLAARKLRERKGKIYTITGGYRQYQNLNRD